MAAKARPKSEPEPPPTYFFYFSYSRTDRGPELDRFFDDLSHEVSLLAGRPEPVGFRDMGRIAPGDRWQRQVDEGISRSRSFVAVLTPSYFHSEYCLQELGVFGSHLSRLPESTGSRLVFPVLWIPFRLDQAPPLLVSRLLPSHPSEGLRHLLRSGKRRVYLDFLHRFTRALVEAVEQEPLPHIQESPKQLQPELENVEPIPSKVPRTPEHSPPLSSPEPLDLLGLAFRLVLARHAEPELLQSLTSERIGAAIEPLGFQELTRSNLVQAQELLRERFGEVSPNPLWLAWMRATQGKVLQALEEQIAP